MRSSLLLSISLLGTALSVMTACTTETVKAPAETTPAAAPAATEEETTPEEEAAPAETPDIFGSPISKKTPVVALKDVLANPEQFKDKRIVTEGNVRQVCQQEGCWAEIRELESTAAAAETMRCTFEGYQFVIPKDSKGSNIRVEGTVSVQLLSASEVAHLEGEGATPFKNKKPDGSAIVSQLVARGVEMTGYKGTQKK